MVTQAVGANCLRSICGKAHEEKEFNKANTHSGIRLVTSKLIFDARWTEMIRSALSLLTAVAIVGCQSVTMSDETSFGENLTKDAVSERAMNVNPDMSRDQVVAVFGRGPSARSFRGSAEAMIYCGRSDWDGSAVYHTVWLNNGTVQAMTRYSLDKSENNCGESAREIDWGQLPADLKVRLDIY